MTVPDGKVFAIGSKSCGQFSVSSGPNTQSLHGNRDISWIRIPLSESEAGRINCMHWNVRSSRCDVQVVLRSARGTGRSV